MDAFRVLLLLVVVALSGATSFGSQSQPTAEPRTLHLIRSLGDERFLVRERAMRELREMGEAAEPVLQRELDRAPTLEVRARLERLLWEIEKANFDEDAWEFAGTLMKAAQLIEKQHFTPVDQRRLLTWCVEGLYRESKAPMPAKIRAALDKLEMLDPVMVRRRIHDACTRGNLRRKVAGEQDLKLCLDALFARLEPGARPGEGSGYIDSDSIYKMRFPSWSKVDIVFAEDLP